MYISFSHHNTFDLYVLPITVQMNKFQTETQGQMKFEQHAVYHQMITDIKKKNLFECNSSALTNRLAKKHCMAVAVFT